MSTMKKKKLLKNRFVGLALLIGVGSAGAMDLLQAYEAARLG
jgi:hypothetical protein